MTDQTDNSVSLNTHAPTAAVFMPEPTAQVRLLPWLITSTVVSLIALITAICAIVFERVKYEVLWDQYQQLENEYRLQEMYIMELDAKLVGNGILKSNETYISLRPKSQLKEVK